MTDEELIARLRNYGHVGTVLEAADRIEALVKYRDAYAEMERIATDALRKSEARAERLEALLKAWIELAANCSIEEGVCCCGDNMEGHSSPWNCGHSPVDHGAYVARRLAEDTAAALKGADHDDEELIARLRGAPADGLGTENLCIAAADRIEALVKERETSGLSIRRMPSGPTAKN